MPHTPHNLPARTTQRQTIRLDKATLRELNQERFWPYFIRLVVILLLLLGLHGLLHWIVFTPQLFSFSVVKILLIGLIMGMLGMIMAGLMVFFHELSHLHWIKNPTLNLLTGCVLSLPLAVPYPLYGLAHQKHHAYNTTDLDPSRYDRPRSKLLHGLAWLTHYTQLSFLMSIFSMSAQANLPRMKLKPSAGRMGLTVWLYACLVATAVLAPQQWLWHFLLPWLAFAFWNTTRAIGEHEYLYVGEDGHKRPLESTRSIRMGWLTRFLWWNAGYHIEHHLYPSMPFHNLPLLAQKLGLPVAERLTYWQYIRYRRQRGVEYPMYF